jgi:hypothetical protein
MSDYAEGVREVLTWAQREGYRNEIMDALDALEQENARLRQVLSDALEVLGPCDTGNPHVEVWCIRHQQRRCDVPLLRAVLFGFEPTEDDQWRALINGAKSARPTESPMLAPTPEQKEAYRRQQEGPTVALEDLVHPQPTESEER